MRSVKNEILRLRSEGKSYSEIVKELHCSRGTVSYHCGIGQKAKGRERCRKARLIYKKETTEECLARKRREYERRKKKHCLFCGKITSKRFCNPHCYARYKIAQNFSLIERNEFHPNIGYNAIGRWIRRYLIYKFGDKCMKCGWGEINPFSGRVPIELEHIDGNPENNALNNVLLLCPNCHSLTSTFRSLNKGNGRHNRMMRYYNGKSY